MLNSEALLNYKLHLKREGEVILTSPIFPQCLVFGMKSNKDGSLMIEHLLRQKISKLSD